MKIIKFIFYLLKHGSWKQSRFDFEGERRRILNELPVTTPMQANSKKSLFTKLVQRSNGVTTLLTNLAFAKNASTMNNMFFISDAKQVVYVRVLKSASTSVLKEFLPILDHHLTGISLSDKQIDALAFYYGKKEIKPQQSMFKRFVVVRNPFERIVSIYLDLFDPKENHFTYADYWFGVLNRSMNFKEFVTTISKIPAYWMGPHFTPQHQILHGAGGVSKVSCFRMEKDKTALDDFLNHYSITLPLRNKQSVDYDYRIFYDEESLQITYALYQEDVKILGYEEDYTLLLNFVHDIKRI